MARRYREVDIDFGAIETALDGLEPPTLALEEVLGKLRARLAEKRDQGVTLAVLCRTLKDHGVTVGTRALGHFLDTGELPGRAAVNGQVGTAGSRDRPEMVTRTDRRGSPEGG